jgi:ribonucleotide reductase beta subunit family protein with ferritin-like domain
VLIHDFDTKQIGITEDEKYIWYVANKRRPLNPGERPIYTGMTTAPYNHVMVFDAHTGIFLFDYSTDEAHFNFVVEGKSYSIVFSLPSIFP